MLLSTQVLVSVGAGRPGPSTHHGLADLRWAVLTRALAWPAGSWDSPAGWLGSAPALRAWGTSTATETSLEEGVLTAAALGLAARSPLRPTSEPPSFT